MYRCCNFESHVTRRGPIALEIQLWKSLPQNDVMSRPLQPPLYYLVGQVRQKIVLTMLM